jgi:hypothetical protein
MQLRGAIAALIAVRIASTAKASLMVVACDMTPSQRAGEQKG